jgi:hypothetical protein
MRRLRHFLGLGGLIVSLAVLAACGASPTATSAPPPSSAPASSAPPSTAPAASASAAPITAPGTATRTTATAATSGSATAVSTASPTTAAAATASRVVSPVTGTPVTGTATRTGSPTAGAVAPPQAYSNLQKLASSRQSWTLSGFNIGGLSGEMKPVFEYSGGNRRVTLAGVTPTVEAIQVGSTTYVRNPLGGFVQATSGDPLGATAVALFGAPEAILGALIPAGGTYTAAGTETVNGQQATRYTTTTTLTDLAFINPALAGQGGTATTTIWVDNAQGYIVALESTIQPNQGGTAAKARLDVTNVGQVPAITAP